MFIVSPDDEVTHELHKEIRETYGKNKSDSIVAVKNADSLLDIVTSRLDLIGGEIARIGILNFNDDSFASTIIPQLEGILKAAQNKVHNIYTATSDQIKTLALRTKSIDETQGIRAMDVEQTNKESNLQQKFKDFANMVSHNYAEKLGRFKSLWRPKLKAATIEEFNKSIYQPSGPQMTEHGIKAFMPFVEKVIGLVPTST